MLCPEGLWLLPIEKAKLNLLKMFYLVFQKENTQLHGSISTEGWWLFVLHDDVDPDVSTGTIGKG